MQQLAVIQNDGRVSHSGVTVPEGYEIRKAVRAILTDGNSQIALLHVTKYGYHKLPGGGLEENEDVVLALKRELKEEVGCDANIKGEIGFTTELWDDYKEFQQSFCYFAQVTGEIGRPEFTENELKHGFEVVWADSIDTAIQMLENDKPTNYEGILICSRDLEFLNAAKQQVN